MTRTFFAAALWLAATGRVFAFTSNAGGNASQFLTLGAGARALGMGEAFGPVAEGAEAIYWNPAGLAALRTQDFIYDHSEFLRFFRYDFAAYALPVSLLHGTVAASLARFSQDDLTAVTNTNQSVGTFSPHGEAVSLAYAYDFGRPDPRQSDREYFRDNWALAESYRPLERELEPWSGHLMAGLAIKVINETIYDRSSAAVALDGGALYRPLDWDELRMSFAFRNLGSKQNFGADLEDLPSEMDAGLAYDLHLDQGRLLSALEAAVPTYGNPYGKIGFEFTSPVAPQVSMAYRLGYKTLAATDLGILSGLTIGVGVNYKKFSLDFGFEPMAALGEVYRLSLGFRY